MFLDTTLPRVFSQGKDLCQAVRLSKVTRTARNAVLTNYVVARAIGKLNETVSNNIGVLYDKDDDKSSFDVTPLVLDNSTRSIWSSML